MSGQAASATETSGAVLEDVSFCDCGLSFGLGIGLASVSISLLSAIFMNEQRLPSLWRSMFFLQRFHLF